MGGLYLSLRCCQAEIKTIERLAVQIKVDVGDSDLVQEKSRFILMQ